VDSVSWPPWLVQLPLWVVVVTFAPFCVDSVHVPGVGSVGPEVSLGPASLWRWGFAGAANATAEIDIVSAIISAAINKVMRLRILGFLLRPSPSECGCIYRIPRSIPRS
jgi:hypothetical protein